MHLLRFSSFLGLQTHIFEQNISSRIRCPKIISMSSSIYLYNRGINIALSSIFFSLFYKVIIFMIIFGAQSTLIYNPVKRRLAA